MPRALLIYLVILTSASVSAQTPPNPLAAGRGSGGLGNERSPQSGCGGNRKTWLPRWETMALQSAFGRESDAARRGRAAFQVSGCSNCHGPAGEGGSGPDLLRSTLVHHDSCGNDIKKSIVEGHSAQGMPATPPSEAQIYDIVDYLHRRIDETDFNPLYGRAEVERMLVTGDPVAGKTYFEGAGGCSGCHSPSGDLKGIASKYDAVGLELRFISPTTSRRKATVTLTTGQKIQGQLLSLDSFDVSIIGDDGWNRTWPRKAVKVDVQDGLAAHWDLIQKYSSADIHNLLAYMETLK